MGRRTLSCGGATILTSQTCWPAGDPSNAQWQIDAAWSRYCIANFLVRIKDGDRNEARRLVAEGIEIIKRLERHAELDMGGQGNFEQPE